MAKVLEKAAFQQLYDYLNSNCLLSPNQSGYKQNHSCETALFATVNDLQVVIHDDNLAAVVMLNLSAAFDTVAHQRLLFKLKHYFGINGNVLKWLTSYLNNQTSAVVINNVYSTKKSLLFGVPQGSILGPLLFIMYINELRNLGSEFDVTIHLYADDTTLNIGFSPDDCFQNAIENIKCCLSKIDKWMSCNFLKFNLNKTQLLVCSKARFLTAFQPCIQSLKSSIHLNSDPAFCIKLLGVFIDETLSFDRMINETCRICFYKLTKLRNLRSFLEARNKIMLVKCFILSCLDYCNSVYANIPLYLVHKLERVLNVCIRFICNIPMNNHNFLLYYKECHILPIQYRIKYKLCLIAFKIVNNLAPQYFTDTTYFYRPLRENLRIGNDRFILNSRHHV